MSRTYRNRNYQQCVLKTPKHLGAKRAQIENRELCKDFNIFLGNRNLHRKIPNPYDDIVISSYRESRYQYYEC